MLQVRLLINPSRRLLKTKLVLNCVKKELSVSTRLSNKKLKSVLLKRFLATQTPWNQTPLKLKPPYSLRVLLLSLFTVGLSTGLLMGYFTGLGNQFFADKSRRVLILSHPNPVTISHGESKEIEHPSSMYSQFPLQITLYQYTTSPLSAQIRAYLDYFGFTYDLIEVDPYAKSEVKSFEKTPHVPICVLQDRNTDRHWFLYDSSTIMSALETLRTENYADFYRLIPRYLPIVVHLDDLQQELRYPNRYAVSENSDLNDASARKWINTTVMPVFKWNAADTKRHAAETVEMLAERCHWKERFGAFRRWYLKYSYKNALYNSRDEFKNEIRHLNPSTYSNPMDAVHDVVSRWENIIGDDRGSPFHGHGAPDLADLSMYGAISAYEGCELFDEALTYHKKFSNWFGQMQEHIEASFGGEYVTPTHGIDWLKLKNDALNRARSITDDAKQSASSFAEKVKSTFGLAAQKVSEVEDKVEEAFHTVYGKAKDEGESLYERGKKDVVETLESSVEKATTKTSGNLKQRISQTSSSLFEPTGEQPEEPYLDPDLDLDVKTREAFGLLGGKTADLTKAGQRKIQKVKEDIKEDVSVLVEKGKHKVHDLVEDASDAVANAKDKVVDSARGINESIKDEANYVVDKTKQKMSQFADIVQEEARAFVGAVKEKAKEDTEKVLEKAEDKGKQLSEKAKELEHRLRKGKKRPASSYVYIDSDEFDVEKPSNSGVKNTDLKPLGVLAFSYLSLLAAFAYASSK